MTKKYDWDLVNAGFDGFLGLEGEFRVDTETCSRYSLTTGLG